MTKLRNVALGLAVALAPPAALACGPDFPAQLLDDRAATLAGLPEGAFSFEVAHLVAPAKLLPVVEAAADGSDPHPPDRDEIERGWWGDDAGKLPPARNAAGADAAYAIAAGLPEEARLYVAGAAAFAHGDYEAAARRFRGVLDLPPATLVHYGVWAQYMLGRVAYARHRSADALAAFAATRAMVAQAADDPLGVAAASLGDEARVHLDAGEDAAAVALYAQQAALGSVSGRDSLLFVARAIVRDDARLDRAVADPLTQRLLAAYLYSRSDELIETSVPPHTDDGAPTVPAGTKVERFLAAIERAGIEHVDGADRLAALAYRSGRFDLAEKLAPKQDSGLAYWVRAKLALRKGDTAGAAQAYAQAAKAFPADEQWGTEQMMVYEPTKPRCRVEGEHGTLALSRGEYVQAMEHLYNAASQYWNDAAYVAERVLSADELEAFVDAHARPEPPRPKPEPEDERGYWLPNSPAGSLRALLARRLLREQRFDEALKYFDDPALRAKAQAYVDARRAATHGDRIEQARAWYAAAHAARVDGMEILGFELDPDFAVYAGDFQPDSSADTDADDLLAHKDKSLPWFGADEAKRVLASRARPRERFHYRYVAVGFAQKSADLLPPRTQAFAAVLCHATHWVIDRNPDVGQQVYKRYLKQGPYVPWGASFGRDCPEPDFAAAAERLRRERIAHYKHLARQSLPYVAAAGALAIVLIAVVAQRRRKAKARPDRS